MNTPQTRVAVVGAGAFGRNHARVYHELTQQEAAKLVAIVDADPARAKSIAGQFGAEGSHLSVADIYDAESLGEVRSYKAALKAAKK